MNELRKFLFGQRSTMKLKPLCQQCIQNGGSKKEVFGMSYAAHKFLSQRFSTRLKSTAKSVLEKIDIVSELFSKQCNVVIAQRIRRSYQILLLYRNLYGEHLLKEKVSSKFNKIRKKPLFAVLSASFFNWDRERITDSEIKKAEVDAVHHLAKRSKNNPAARGSMSVQWEQIVDKENFKVWRTQVPNSELFQYRVLGHFSDIPARAFYNTQVDVAYWKVWDQQTMDVKIVDKDEKTGSEVIQWLYKFPFPMYPREYVYVRRCVVDQDTKTMIITARATSHPKCPGDESSVRITTYTSKMMITPDKSFDENGFTYVMSYRDDPQTNFSPMWYNWMATAGVHDFIERIHHASRNKHSKMAESTGNRMEDDSPLYSGMVHQ